MKKLVILIGLAACLLAPAAAMAHPLGNFTVNRYSRVQPSGDRIYVLYVLDMAEIPTFREKAAARDHKSRSAWAAEALKDRLGPDDDDRLPPEWFAVLGTLEDGRTTEEIIAGLRAHRIEQKREPIR